MGIGFCLLAACNSAYHASSLTLTTVTAQPQGTVIPNSFSQSTAYPDIDTLHSPYPAHSVVATNQPYIATLEAGLTLTAIARPTLTTTPTIPVAARPCHSSELSSSIFSYALTHDQFNLYLTLTHIGQEICVLEGPPSIRLVDRDGSILTVNYLNKSIPASPLNSGYPSRAATENPIAKLIGLGPGGQVRVLLYLYPGSSCALHKRDGTWIRLELARSFGTLDVLFLDDRSTSCSYNTDEPILSWGDFYYP
jgi:hypothetical protein